MSFQCKIEDDHHVFWFLVSLVVSLIVAGALLAGVLFVLEEIFG